MLDFSQTLSGILDSYAGLRAIVLRPLLRVGSAAFAGNMDLLQVIS
jgi:hypothetical protein